MITNTLTIHCSAEDCIGRISDRNDKIFDYLNDIRDLLYKRDPKFKGKEWELLDQIEKNLYANQPDIEDVKREINN